MANAHTTTQEQSLNGWTPEEQALIAADAIDSDVFADRLFKQLEAAPAFLSSEEIYELEESIQRDQIRRAAFAFASISGADLCNKIENDREFAVIAAGISNEMTELQAKYRGLAELFEGLHGRITVALCSREDMLQVMKEGEAVIV